MSPVSASVLESNFEVSFDEVSQAETLFLLLLFFLSVVFSVRVATEGGGGKAFQRASVPAFLSTPHFTISLNRFFSIS